MRPESHASTCHHNVTTWIHCKWVEPTKGGWRGCSPCTHCDQHCQPGAWQACECHASACLSPSSPSPACPCREVLRRFGNVSSATVLFVLEELLKRREEAPAAVPEWGLAIGIGPGVTMEGVLMRMPQAARMRTLGA